MYLFFFIFLQKEVYYKVENNNLLQIVTGQLRVCVRLKTHV